MDSDYSPKDPVKEAFAKAKQDVTELKNHISFLYQEINEIKHLLHEISQNLSAQTNRPTDQQILPQTQTPQNQTFQQIIPTQKPASIPLPTDNLPLYDLKSSNINSSIGNRGVPADRQTVQQTDQHIGNEGVRQINPNIGEIQNVSQLLTSLDSIKQEVRVKFKNLTSQEILVFSTIYQLEEESQTVTYPCLASKLSLTESSIRDYTQKLIKKGIPILKSKVNNKQITLSISPELKKIASLNAILQLRGI